MTSNRGKYLMNIWLLVLFLLPVSMLAEEDNKLGLRTIVIDAGHGGHDPGAISKDKKTQEKNVVLDIAKRFGQKISEAHPDVKVVYTRTKDVYLTLNERAAKANSNDADLFVSIHVNANNSTSPYGASVHILGQSSKPGSDLFASNMDVCRRENSVILLEEDYTTEYQGFDPNSPESLIFLTLMQNAHYEQSILFASEVDRQLRKTAFKPSKYTGIHQDPFYLLWKTKMPAVLIELGFITNPSDLKVLSTTSGRDDIAARLLDAFNNFKADYDRSLEIGTSSVPAVSEAEGTDAPVVKNAFGIQIMGLARKLAQGDPALKGFDALALKGAGSSIYKYIVYVSDDLEQVQSKLSRVRSSFPEAFIVKVENDQVTRLK